MYNLVTDTNLQVNSRFVFLNEGRCPVADGKADINCWSHPGSYIGELSFQQMVDGTLHAALFTAGDAERGFVLVHMHGKAIAVGESITYGSFSVNRTSPFTVLVRTEQFEFLLSNSDMFIS